jgi:hypothetical protein
MSWNVETFVKTKEKAQEVIEGTQHIPPDLKVAIQAQIKALVLSPGACLHLKTNGHLDASGGDAEFKLRQVPIVE